MSMGKSYYHELCPYAFPFECLPRFTRKANYRPKRRVLPLGYDHKETGHE